MIEKINLGKYDKTISLLTSDTDSYKKRLINLINSSDFDMGTNIRIFSAPGRSEIGGNHTDHQKGKVLACSIDLDILAIVQLNNSDNIIINSQGYNSITISLNDLSMRDSEKGTTRALVRGIANRFTELSYKLSGFTVFMTSNVLKGSGLSSSAAFETLIGTIINELFCDSKESAISIAKIGQYAENVYFDKPSGLMDQMASAVGSFVHIDFYDEPKVTAIKADFKDYNLCIIDTGGDHADLTDDYTDIITDLKSVSNFFGEDYLSRVSADDFYNNIEKLRLAMSDRAIVRAIHFFDENMIADMQASALKKGDMDEFLSLIQKSGYSSFMHLQNAYSIKNPKNQGLVLALALCKRFLANCGAYRLHGGGFAGTIQAFVPNDLTNSFKCQIEKVFGANKCYVLSIRPVGSLEIKEN